MIDNDTRDGELLGIVANDRLQPHTRGVAAGQLAVRIQELKEEIERLREAQGEAVALTGSEVMEAFRACNPTKAQYDALTYTVWKDGIDVDFPTTELCTMMQRTVLPPPSNDFVGEVRECQGVVYAELTGDQFPPVGTKLYKAPPPPSVPNKLTVDESAILPGIITRAEAYTKGWNDCRKAVLNAAKQETET